MSWLTRLRFGLAGVALKAASLTIVPRWVRASFLEPSFERLVADGYRANSAVMACTAALVFGFSEPPLRIWTEEGDNGEPIPQHPLRLLLRRPNPVMGERMLMAYTMAYLAIGGNAYWHKVRNGSGRVIGLWPYHAGHMLPVPGGDNWIAGYTFDGGTGQLQDVPVEDVVHFRWPLPDPEQPWMALPPIVAAAREVDMDNEARRYVYALLRNDAVPRVALEMPDHVTVDPDMEMRLKAQWRQKYGGDNRGDVAIMTGGAKANRIALDLNELAYEALGRVPEARISAVMRVPPIIAGLNVGLERSTFSNYGEARSAFAQDTLSTLWELMASEVDRTLVPEFGNDTLDARYDLRQVRALQEDANMLWGRVNNAVRSGYLTINEARRAVGFEEVPDGEIFLWSMTDVPQDTTALGAALEPVATPLLGQSTRQASNEPARAAKAGPHASKASRTARRQARRLQRIRLDLIEAMADDVDDYFADLAQRVIDRAEESGKAGQPGQAKAPGDELPDVDELLQPEDEERLRQLMNRYYTEIIQASWQAWGEMLDDDEPFSLTNPVVRETLSQAGDNVVGITDTTKDAIRQLLAHGYDQGWGIRELVNGDDDQPGLRSIVTQTYQGRARTIARTELGTAQQAAAVRRYEQTGVSRVQVLDNGFDNSDPRCVELDGTIQTLEWAAANPIQHPNCVRAFAPVFED